jgi:pimeloyl-ACP methyl ester carboxylesterase
MVDKDGNVRVEPHFHQVDVAGGQLWVARWGSGSRTLLGIHGITASSMSLAPVAHRLDPEFTLLAPDLRGRGRSGGLPGPFGMRTHAADCAAVVEALGSAPAWILGESMGAFVAVMLAATRSELVQGLVLGDGGLPNPVPDGVDPDVVLAATLGPALERLQQVFPSRDAYRQFWRRHPAFTSTWTDDVETFVDYDLEQSDGGFRSRVSEEAVRFDGRELLVEAGDLQAALASIRCPIALFRAPRNLLDQPTPLIPDGLVAGWQQQLPQLKHTMVEGTNHYTLFFGDTGSAVLAGQINSSMSVSP